jgi:hypothetical protein
LARLGGFLKGKRKRNNSMEGVLQEPNEKTRFVILKGLKEGNRFFSSFKMGDFNPTKLSDGTVAYCVLGYCETIAKAQMFLFGRTFTPIGTVKK